MAGSLGPSRTGVFARDDLIRWIRGPIGEPDLKPAVTSSSSYKRSCPQTVCVEFNVVGIVGKNARELMNGEDPHFTTTTEEGCYRFANMSAFARLARNIVVLLYARCQHA
jgi:hypothetical protein